MRMNGTFVPIKGLNSIVVNFPIFSLFLSSRTTMTP